MSRDPLERIYDIHNVEGIAGGINLSEWEEEFLASILDQLANDRKLTQNQLDKLEQIWDRI